ncbi:MAG TPA: DUF4403 family protein [Rhizomicrobium sp.]
MRRPIVLAAALVLAGCGFTAPVAKRTPPPPEPQPPVSTVSATLAVPAPSIARMLNEKTEEKIAELNGQSIDCKFTRCQLDLIATRNGAATVSAANGGMSLAMPFTIDARIKAKALFMNLGATGHGTGIARATTTLSLSPTWQVAARTTGDVKLEQSQIALAGMRLDFTDVLNKNSEKLSRPLFVSLDRQIPRAVKLKPQVEKLWAQAFRPIRVGKKPLAWLLLQPEKIRFAPPQTAHDALQISLAVEGRARVVVTDTPPVLTPTPLPNLSPLEERGNAFRFFVPATLSYADASRLAMAALQKKPVRIGNGMTVRFEQLAILPSGQDVVVQARFCVRQGWWDIFDWFDSCGTGYLRGVPVFDQDSETIRIVHVHYDVATEGIVLNLARAFEGDALGKELEKRLVFAVGKDVAKLRESIRQTLARPQGRDITISAQLQDFGTPTLSWTANGFIAFFSAQGQVQAVLHLR